MKSSPTMGVALGGGGARGLAHLQALEVLERVGRRPDAIVGTSMGAIMGALYASGMTPASMRRMVEQRVILSGDGLREIYEKREGLISMLKVFRPAMTRSGLLSATGFLKSLLAELGLEAFSDLSIPLRVVATDYVTGEPVIFEDGPLLPAVTASMAIPGVFAPVRHAGRLLVDGGVSNNVPYDLLPTACDLRIAVDVAPDEGSRDEPKPNLVDAVIGMFDIMMSRATQEQVDRDPPSLYVRPGFSGIRVLEFEKAEEVFRQAQPAMDAFEKALGPLLGEMGGGAMGPDPAAGKAPD